MGRDKYKSWRLAVFKRDNFTCIQCFSNKNIQADHIVPWCASVELRYEVSNGRTLCKNCHQKTDTYGTKALKHKRETL